MLAYNPPGVSFREENSPIFAPLLQEPTSIGIVGPALGYIPANELVEQTLLVDNQWYTLSQTGIDLGTLTVTDVNGTAYQLSGTVALDYVYDPTLNRIRRDMPTNIADGQTVAVYYTSSSGATGHTDQLTLNELLSTSLVFQNSGIDFVSDTSNSIIVMSQGLAPTADFTIVAGGSPTIALTNSPTVLQTHQKIYVDCTVGNTQLINQAVTLNGTTPVSLPSGSTGWLIKTGPVVVGETAVVYTKGAQGSGTVQTGDYIVSGSATGLNLAINRSNGTTQMGVANDSLQVTISYQATPDDYWLPTRVYSVSDCTARFGEALNPDGSIASPVSLAASFAFSNGATDMVIQPLYHLATHGDTTSAHSPGGTVDASHTLQDWEDTLLNMRDVEDVNVLVPIISAGGGTENDNNNLAILTQVQLHIEYMATQNQLLVALCGQDSTVAGCTANAAFLRQTASGLGAVAGNGGESMVHVSPASFGYPNPVTGQTTNLGGQYVAASLAGMLAANSISTPLTRKQIAGVITVNEYRSEQDKNTDAMNGLLVVESKQGVIRVRHAITCAVNNVNSRELSVIRAKHYMIESVRDDIDNQIIGNVVADGQAGFTIQLCVQSTLDRMINEGAVVTYSDIQARQLTNDPTQYEVRFSYLPAFPLNYVQIVFSIDTSSGAITTASTSTQGA